MELAEDVDIDKLASKTHGYVGADLAQLCSEAGMNSIRRQMDYFDIEDVIPGEVLNSMKITMKDFEYGLKVTNPSCLRDVMISVPDVKWNDIGGLEDTKQALQEMISFPVEHASKFAMFNMKASRGCLFYGPPGCGKTLMAKAVANECEANFISIKGPQLLNKYVGESESNVREIFTKARSSQPCILFFDEIDSIAGTRSMNGGGGPGDSVVNALLTEMDGVGAKKDVFIIAATNKPWTLDPALCRPGRFDKFILIPMPDQAAREKIIGANLRKSPVADDVNFEYMAQQMDGFSGADITEVMQKSCRRAITELISKEKEAIAEGKMDEDGKLIDLEYKDPVPVLTRKHFEYGMIDARSSVTPEQNEQYVNWTKSEKDKNTIKGSSEGKNPNSASQESKQFMIEGSDGRMMINWPKKT